MRGSFLSRRAVQRLRQLAIYTLGSVKIKLLLSCIIALTVIALLSGSGFMGWNNHSAALDQLPVPRCVQLDAQKKKKKMLISILILLTNIINIIIYLLL
jgi:hypothetical protein